MSVSKEDREAYEKGLKESRRGGLDNFFDFQSTLHDMIFHSASESAAYRKGQAGEQLDEDKAEPEPHHESASAPSSTSDEDISGTRGSSYDDSDSYSYTPSSSCYSPSVSSTESGPVTFGVVVVALFVIGALFYYANNPQSANDTYSPPASNVYRAPIYDAPEQIVDRGVCPFEGCRYSEEWVARQDVDVYIQPPYAHGVDISSLQKKVAVRAGEWVTTETGMVLAKRHFGRVVSGTSFGAAVQDPTQINIGHAIPLYSYLGENCWTGWISYHTLVVCSPELYVGKPQNEWWIQIKLVDGSEAWTNSPRSFASQAVLNSELGNKIADRELPLLNKLADISVMIWKGADINGDGGKYGTTPMEAAINSKDTVLLGELLLKGLDLRDSKPCPAFWATWKALDPGGDVMLAFLLENGMQLGCLAVPPIIAFLRLGIATDNYSSEHAAKVAAVLVAHGARLDDKDSQGMTIFDLLNQESVARLQHAAKLEDALNKLAETSPASTEQTSPNPTPPGYGVGF